MADDQFEHDKPWEIRKNESTKKYLLFGLFKDLGVNRTLRKAMEIYNKNYPNDTVSLSYFQKLSRQNDWVDRCYAYDVYIQGLIMDNNEDMIREMKSRHSTLSKRFQNLIMEALNYGSANYKELTSNQLGYFVDSLSRALERCARLERVSYGTEDVSNNELYKEFKYDISDIKQIMSDPETSRKLTVYLDAIDKLDSKNKDQDKQDNEVILVTN